MKRLLILLLLIALPFYGFSDNDSLLKVIRTDVAEQKTSINTIAQKVNGLADSIGTLKNSAQVAHPCKACDTEKGGPGLPAVLCVMMGLLFGVLVIVVIKRFNFNLNEALSENSDDLVIQENPYYKELPGLIEKLAQAQAQAGTLAADNAKTKAQQATAAREQAAQTLATAQDAVKQAGDAATDDQKKVVADALANLQKAQQAETQAKSEESSAGGTSLSPATLINLSNLFPPTIQTTKTSTSGETKYRPSISRLIAFLSGVIMIIVGISMTCFYIYYYLCTGYAPEIASLSAVLIGLGLGMAPYAVNKIANTTSSKQV